MLTSTRAAAVHDESPVERHHTVLWLHELRLLAELGVQPGWAVQFQLPARLVQTRTVLTDLSDNPTGLTNIHHPNGLFGSPGDVQFLVHHARKLGPLSAGVRAGLSLPFGQVNQDPYLLGDQGAPHTHLQFGTGTADPLLGLDLGLGPVAAYAFAQLPLYEGSHGYRAGSRVAAGVTASHALGAVSLRLGSSVIHEEPERWRGLVPTEDGNLGRTDLFVSPGVTLTSGDYSFSLDLLVRAWGHTEGAQLDMPVVVQLAVGKLFHLEPPEPDAAPAAMADVLDVVQAGELAALVPAPGKLTVFDFWAPWCEACKGLDQRLRALAAEKPGLAVRRVNIVDFDSPIAQRELPGVTLLPHLRFVDASGKVLFDASGTSDELFTRVRDSVNSP